RAATARAAILVLIDIGISILLVSRARWGPHAEFVGPRAKAVRGGVPNFALNRKNGYFKVSYVAFGDPDPSGPGNKPVRSKLSTSCKSSQKQRAPWSITAWPFSAVASVASPTAPSGLRSCAAQANGAGRCVLSHLK